MADFLSHIFIGIADFDRALRFYRLIAGELGLEESFCEPDQPWAGWRWPGQSRPLIVIAKPFDGRPHDPGNGQMTAFQASDRGQVRRVHEIALAAGGTCEGPPGLRTHYHPDYYGAYFRDTEGNKLCVVCHQPGGEAD